MTTAWGWIAAALVLAGGADWIELRAVDAATGRGVPGVEFESVHREKWVTDNEGRAALPAEEWAGRAVFFHVRSHGYEARADGFGYRGLRTKLEPGRVHEVRLTRTNVAERLVRLTGEGRLRDTVLLGHAVEPWRAEALGQVAGQDTVQAVVHGERTYWFWGDTSRMSYPLGLFRTAGATTPKPTAEFDPAWGVPYAYFTGPDGFARAMFPLPERREGVIWVHGVCRVPDATGAMRIVCHYSRRKGLGEEYEQGIGLFDEAEARFEVAKVLPAEETWRRPAGQAVEYEAEGKRWILFATPAANVRVPAQLENVLDPEQYEAFTCAKESDGSEPDLDEDGRSRWRWTKAGRPTTSEQEQRWVREGKVRAEATRFLPADAANPSERVRLHSGSVRWNEHRRRWVMVAGQFGGKTSLLGEVWYAESREPWGPFARAVKVVTHDRQSFYNVCQHAFFDRDGGRTIHFEGTYTQTFSGNPEATPRYEYNQILYRLDVDDPRLGPARVE
jgi:hypothetical protein